MTDNSTIARGRGRFAQAGTLALLALIVGTAAGMAVAAPAPRLAFTAEEMALALSVAGDPALASAYGARGLRPIFDTSADPGAQMRREAVLHAVGQAAENGLPPARYRAAELRAAPQGGDMATETLFAQSFVRWVGDLGGGLVDPRQVDPATNHRVVLRPDAGKLLAEFAQSPDPAALLASVEPRDPRYAVLKKALAAQAGLVAPADTPEIPATSLRPGDDGAAVAALRVRLAAMGFDAGPGSSYDEALAAEVAKFQKAVGLGVDGVAGPRTIGRLNQNAAPQDRAILMAMERFRWLAGHDPNARQVWVNLPEFVAHIYDGGVEEFATRVVIGRTETEYNTPEFSDEMEYVVVNPRWNVPRSMTVKEYLPRLQKNPNAASHLDVLDARGRVVPRGQVNFSKYTAANFPYRLQQKPSDGNALGQVKFIFPNPWNIYLHDTPSKGLFNNATRAYSHGCVRVGRPVDLAHHLLRGQVMDPAATYDRALRSGRETFLKLEPAIPVHLVYFTLLPDADGKLHRFPDIYGRDGRLWAALAKAGLESATKGQ